MFLPLRSSIGSCGCWEGASHGGRMAHRRRIHRTLTERNQCRPNRRRELAVRARRRKGRTAWRPITGSAPRRGLINFWKDPSNWSGGVPAISNDVAITATGTYTVVITAAERPYQIRSLHLGGASGTIRLIDDGSLSVLGSATLTHSILDVGAGGTGSIFGNFILDANSTAMTEGVFNVGGGIIDSGGTVEVDGGSLFVGSIFGSGDYAISSERNVRGRRQRGERPPTSPSPILVPIRSCSTMSAAR